MSYRMLTFILNIVVNCSLPPVIRYWPSQILHVFQIINLKVLFHQKVCKSIHSSFFCRRVLEKEQINLFFTHHVHDEVLIYDRWRSLYIQSIKRLKYTMFKWCYLKGQSLHKIIITRPILHKQTKRHIFTHAKANGLVFQTTAEPSVMLSSDRILYTVTRCPRAFSEVQRTWWVKLKIASLWIFT